MNLEIIKTELEKNKLFDRVERAVFSEEFNEYRFQIVFTKNNVLKLYRIELTPSEIDDLKNNNEGSIEDIIINKITTEIEEYK